MPKRKTVRKTSRKPVKKSVSNFQHTRFLFLLVLFCSLSLYAISSYLSSTNDYLDDMYVSVVGNIDGPVEVISSKTDIFASLFRDVGAGHIHAEAIGVLNAEGIIKGYGDGSFRPDGLINRAELLTILTNALDSDFSGRAYGDCFSDVKDQWFAVFVCYAKDQGWVSGFADGSYKAKDPVIKAEVLKIVFSAFDYEICEEVLEKPFNDVKTGDWYAPYACAAKRDGIIVDKGFFDASHKVTRAEYVQVIYNVMREKGLL